MTTGGVTRPNGAGSCAGLEPRVPVAPPERYPDWWNRDPGRGNAPAERSPSATGTSWRTGRSTCPGCRRSSACPSTSAGATGGAAAHTAAFVSGYEGSPLAGYDLELARQRDLLDSHDVVFSPGLNEELGRHRGAGHPAGRDRRPTPATTASSATGTARRPASTAPSDALRHANLAGSQPARRRPRARRRRPVGEVLDACPAAPRSPWPSMGVPVLVPARPAGRPRPRAPRRRAVAGQRPVDRLKVATNVADGSGTADVRPDRVRRRDPGRDRSTAAPYVHTAVGARFLQPHARAARAQPAPRAAGARPPLRRRQRPRTASSAADRRPDRHRRRRQDATSTCARRWTPSGSTTPSSRRPRRSGSCKLGMLWPLEPRGSSRAFADGLDEIVVVEEKRAFLETGIKDILYGRAGAPAVTGKRDVDGGAAAARRDGDLDADAHRRARSPAGCSAHVDVPGVAAWSTAQQARAPPRRPRADARRRRTPFFCSGCPHNRSTPRTRGIARRRRHRLPRAWCCSMPQEQVGDVTGLSQMGGEGAQWIGMAPFVDDRPLVQNIGDGTFHHSGSLAVRAAVAAGRQHHLQAALQLRGRDDRRAGGVGELTCPALTRCCAPRASARIVVTTEDPERYKRRAAGPGRRGPAPRPRWSSAQEELARSRASPC